ncbi:PWI domain-containing protein [Entophlyctis helioformis]|nr:PWI domain-containing protein [Entophlyctis helioformis]
MFFRGTSAQQDTRFGDKQKKLLRTIAFPACFSQKVDMKKVKLGVIRSWIASKVVEILGIEDDVVIEYVFTLLEEESDPKQMQIKLTGFLEHGTPKFMEELWNLLLSAQSNFSGIPQSLFGCQDEGDPGRKATAESASVGCWSHCPS